ncbi:hypothetical protein VB735_26815 [Halotia wernerae UHCC 0503]|nr:hypothetical protein [Halotia wernerae UHCC 0503]
MEPVTLTAVATAIATIVLTKALEKTGEKLGEAALEESNKLIAQLREQTRSLGLHKLNPPARVSKESA